MMFLRLRRFTSLISGSVHWIWLSLSLILILLLPFVIGGGLLGRSLPVVEASGLWQLVSSTGWKPLQGIFGFFSFITGTVSVSLLALLISFPLCLLTAIYLTQYAHRRLLKWMMPVIDILAGIPSVVYGVWGVLIIVPFISGYLAPLFGMTTSGYCLLAGALVLAVMLVPFMLNIQIEVLRAVPQDLSEASLALGAGKWFTIKKIVLKKSLPGIVSSVVFGLARAFGETIAVLMVIGNVAVIPDSLFSPAYPLPALIANNYGEMLSIPRYDSALMFAALLLFVIVMFFNLGARFLIARTDKH
jgi:phosphate transport system permease protein